MLAEVVDALIAALLVLALWAKPQKITLILVAAYAASIIASHYRHHEALRPILVFIDAAVVVAMDWLYRRTGSTRARVVSTIGMVSIAWAFFSASTGLHWNAYAAAVNGGFILQILVAGGMANGLMAWLGNSNRLVRFGNLGFSRHAGGR